MRKIYHCDMYLVVLSIQVLDSFNLEAQLHV